MHPNQSLNATSSSQKSTTSSLTGTKDWDSLLSLIEQEKENKRRQRLSKVSQKLDSVLSNLIRTPEKLRESSILLTQSSSDESSSASDISLEGIAQPEPDPVTVNGLEQRISQQNGITEAETPNNDELDDSVPKNQVIEPCLDPFIEPNASEQLKIPQGEPNFSQEPKPDAPRRKEISEDESSVVNDETDPGAHALKQGKDKQKLSFKRIERQSRQSERYGPDNPRRSKRNRIRPVEYWRLERIVYRRDSTGICWKFDHVDPGRPPAPQNVRTKSTTTNRRRPVKKEKATEESQPKKRSKK